VTDVVAVAIVGASGLVIAATITGASAVMVKKIGGIHDLVNSRMTEMLILMRDLGHAGGVEDERNRQAQAALVARDSVQADKIG
jgi:hypothetical protein